MCCETGRTAAVPPRPRTWTTATVTVHVASNARSVARADVSVMDMPEGHDAMDTGEAPIESRAANWVCCDTVKKDAAAGQPASTLE